MKKGDVVKVHDSSYSFAIVDGFLEHHPGEVQKEQQLIIAVNCDLPAAQQDISAQHNNIIVRGQISGRMTFVQQRFCHPVPPKHKIMIDVVTHHGCFVYGNVVEISDKLYKEIKRDSQM